MFATLLAAIAMTTSNADWPPTKAPIMTRWAKQVDPANPLPEYPRPQMVRPNWQSLNGMWEYAISPKDAGDLEMPTPQGRILVPFCIESALSGVMKRVTENDKLWYRRKFKVAKHSGRTLLHFGAIDWHSWVEVNGEAVWINHMGGYDGFTADITEAVKPGENEVVIWCTDATGGYQPRGKQWRRPEGIWYTPVTGIWQTVWLEQVPSDYIPELKIVPNLAKSTVEVTVPKPDGEIEVIARDGGKEVGRARGDAMKPVSVKIPYPKLWTPDTPFLYDLEVRLVKGKKVLDSVKSYFGMRSVGLVKDANGVQRLALNGKPIFHLGPLDQGFWPDGIYTAPNDEALKFDIEMTKKLGFNTIRKHVKVEPERWYYWADKLGVMVWQDMPSPHFEDGKQPDADEKIQFMDELVALIEGRGNHPSIVMWVPFNEGWGQQGTEGYVKLIRGLDPSRLVNNASGWTDMKVGDVNDIHNYPPPRMPALESKRAAVLGEFGGLGLAVDGHTWAKQNWGYQGVSDREALTDKYVRFLKQVYDLKAKGLAAAIYTQTTDVETETNGLLTYDREIVKVDIDRVSRANRGNFDGLKEPTVVVPTSQSKAIDWHYTFQQPSDGWEKPDFNPAGWQVGPAGFGTTVTPGAIVRTTWSTGDIWVRRSFVLTSSQLKRPMLRLHHDDDVEVYVNGVLALKRRGWTSEYEDFEITAEARATLVAGTNTIAIHCHQNQGGQYIDAGLVEY